MFCNHSNEKCQLNEFAFYKVGVSGEMRWVELALFLSVVLS